MAIGQEEIGRRIRQAREEADLTQQQLADRIGIETAQSVSRYERGLIEVSTKRLRRIADATDKPLDFFIQIPGKEPDAQTRLEDLLGRTIELLEEILERRPQPQAPAATASGRPG